MPDFSAKRQVIKMKVKLIYGAPCCGKTTYVKNHASDNDLVWDYDKLLIACTNRKLQTTGSHPMADYVVGMREKMLEMASIYGRAAKCQK